MIRLTPEAYAKHQSKVKSARRSAPAFTRSPDPKKPAKPRQIVPREPGRAQLSLPWPPSVNHYWRRNKGQGMHISDEGKAFQNVVAVCCAGMDGVMGRVAVQVIAYPPDRRKRDLDNVFKALLDALNCTGMIEDDALIDDLHITRSECVPGGRVDVVITALGLNK